MMKLCFVHYSSSPGGIEVMMPQIIRMLPGRDISVFVLRPPAEGEMNVYEGTDAKVTYGSSNNFNAAKRLFRFARDRRDAVFHGFNTGPFFLLTLRLAGVRKAVYSIRGTVHYNGLSQKIIRKVAWHLAIAGSYRFIANSEHSRDIFLRYIKIRKPGIEVLYNPVCSERLKPYPEKKQAGSLNIIYVGRLTSGKNLFRWIDIAISIQKMRPEARFSLYGEGHLKEKLEAYCRDRGAAGFISFRGYMKEISEAYHEADLMMFISEYESFGNVAVESILCGTPVLAADIPSLREVFRNFPGFLVPADNRMESEIIRKINNPDELTRALPGVAEEFRSRFSIERHIEGLKGIYESARR